MSAAVHCWVHRGEIYRVGDRIAAYDRLMLLTHYGDIAAFEAESITLRNVLTITTVQLEEDPGNRYLWPYQRPAAAIRYDRGSFWRPYG